MHWVSCMRKLGEIDLQGFKLASLLKLAPSHSQVPHPMSGDMLEALPSRRETQSRSVQVNCADVDDISCAATSCR